MSSSSQQGESKSPPPLHADGKAPQVAGDVEPSQRRSVSRGRSRSRRSGKEVVVHERIVQERIVTGGNTVWPMLTATNYSDWALVMQINFEANLMWEAVEGNAASVATDKAALAALLRSVPPEMVGALAVKGTAKAAWDAVRIMRVGADRVREATMYQYQWNTKLQNK